MVAGRLPSQWILGQREGFRGNGRAAIEQTLVFYRLHDACIAVAEGIGHTDYGLFELFLKVVLVGSQFLLKLLVGELEQAGMRQRVHGDLVAAIERGEHVGLHAAHENILVLPGVFLGLDAGIEVEGALEAVEVEQLHQAHVLGNAVVVGEGERAGLAAREGQHKVPSFTRISSQMQWPKSMVDTPTAPVR